MNGCRPEPPHLEPEAGAMGLPIDQPVSDGSPLVREPGLAVNVLGDGLRDALDPLLRGR